MPSDPENFSSSDTGESPRDGVALGSLSTTSVYSPRLVEHAVHPRNQGSMEHPDAVGTARFERCGDRMRLEFRLSEGRVQEVRCQAFGCGAAVAAGSAATELLAGRTLGEARALTAFELDEALGGVPAPKRHALLMVLECIAGALGGRPPDHSHP